MSLLTCSTERLEWRASVSSSQVRMRMISLAWISMSDAWPCPASPTAGWWIRMRAFGNASRLPGVPAAVSTAAAEAAWPIAVRVLALEHEELGHDVVGRGVVHLHAEEDDAVLEELGIRVLALVAVGGALLEAGQDVAGAWCLHSAEGLTAEAGAAEAGAAEHGGVHSDVLILPAVPTWSPGRCRRRPRRPARTPGCGRRSRSPEPPGR